ncbi:MAG: hypothetical protein KKB74_10115, partial [Bacteroidetes bacterium]|nr:hypothetical protein [Bacteroidota bacterium]
MGIDIDQIRANYKKFSDSKIEYLAKNESASLEPEVIEILKDEIKARGLDAGLFNGIEAQTKELTGDELRELKTKIESLPCPECEHTNSPLIGTLLRTVKSFIFFT